MREKIVAGNWKMNKGLQEGLVLIDEIIAANPAPKCKVIIGTPFIHLASAAQKLNGTPICLAAENCAAYENGAYTGEISAEMVASTGAQYCIIGHSERRSYFGEDFATLRTKVDLALKSGLKVIFCIGEVKEQREQGVQNEVVAEQIEASLFHLNEEQFASIVLAYEPVWAIGTGLTATAEQAQEMHAFIRSLVAKKYGNEVAQNTSILYGGSCNAKNAASLFANEDIDGGLIGGASLKAPDFTTIINAR